MRTLLSYDFPGNIRELRNLVERACILSTADEITSEHFPVAVKAPTPVLPPTVRTPSLPMKSPK